MQWIRRFYQSGQARVKTTWFPSTFWRFLLLISNESLLDEGDNIPWLKIVKKTKNILTLTWFHHQNNKTYYTSLEKKGKERVWNLLDTTWEDINKTIRQKASTFILAKYKLDSHSLWKWCSSAKFFRLKKKEEEKKKGG